MSSETSDYSKYRGKCRELAEQAIENDPTLTLVRGHYFCPMWNTKEQHWWTIDQNNNIIDPSARQFPSKGHGEYIPFDGWVECAECGTSVREEEADIAGRYAFCSYSCHGKFIGVF